MQLTLGIDLGTSSAKVLALDEQGGVRASASAEYSLIHLQPGWVEQNPEDWWVGVCDAVRAVLYDLRDGSPGLEPEMIRGLALSGQMNGAVLADECGGPLRPAVIWLDRRSEIECRTANERAGDLLRDRALHLLNPVNTLGKLLWHRRHELDLYRQTRRLLLPKDWVVHRLTGEFCTDVSDASATAAFDLFRRDWSWEIVDRLELRPEIFPRVYESPAVVGYLTTEASAATGLPTGLPVCAGGADMACMAVGSGVIAPGVVMAGVGTAGHAVACSEWVSDTAFNQIWAMAHAVPGCYYWLGTSYTGGASFTWLCEQLRGTIEELLAEAECGPAGSDGLLFLPWLQGAGTPHPDPAARGAWIGLGLHHGRPHLIRAVLEGILYDIRQILDGFTNAGLPVEEIRIGEGGARSPFWQRMHAQVFGSEVRPLEITDASPLGAALIAGVGTGVFPDFAEACSRAIRLGPTVAVDPEEAAMYVQGYGRYTALYPALRDWFQQQ